jgi:hypothetical protein
MIPWKPRSRSRGFCTQGDAIAGLGIAPIEWSGVKTSLRPGARAGSIEFTLTMPSGLRPALSKRDARPTTSHDARFYRRGARRQNRTASPWRRRGDRTRHQRGQAAPQARGLGAARSEPGHGALKVYKQLNRPAQNSAPLAQQSRATAVRSARYDPAARPASSRRPAARRSIVPTMPTTLVATLSGA